MTAHTQDHTRTHGNGSTQHHTCKADHPAHHRRLIPALPPPTQHQRRTHTRTPRPPLHTLGAKPEHEHTQHTTIPDITTQDQTRHHTTTAHTNREKSTQRPLADHCANLERSPRTRASPPILTRTATASDATSLTSTCWRISRVNDGGVFVTEAKQTERTERCKGWERRRKEASTRNMTHHHHHHKRKSEPGSRRGGGSWSLARLPCPSLGSQTAGPRED
eukprot:2988008-Rhodomonas_salina.1